MLVVSAINVTVILAFEVFVVCKAARCKFLAAVSTEKFSAQVFILGLKTG
jgi:hypothetical protein